MLFANALYYPTIDIKNEQWIRSALLLWDHIETIVPEGMELPYRRNITKMLHEAGFIQPREVNPWNYNVTQIGAKVKVFLATREGKRCFINPKYRADRGARHREFVNEDNEQMIREHYGECYLHASKLPYNIAEDLRQYVNDRGYIQTTSAFLSFYMTLLANNICRNEGVGSCNRQNALFQYVRRMVEECSAYQPTGPQTIC